MSLDTQPDTQAREQARPERLGIVLAGLCVLLIIWGPIELALTVSSALPALGVRGAPLALVILLRIAVVALGVAAGLALWSRRGPALSMARASIVISAATDVFIDLTPYFPSNRMPGDTPFYVAAALVYWTGWWCYLQFSPRVRRIYG
jgi:hypothetical protein